MQIRHSFSVRRSQKCKLFGFCDDLEGMQGETENREMPGHIGGFLKEAPNQQGTDDYNSSLPCGYCVEKVLYGENGKCPAEISRAVSSAGAAVRTDRSAEPGMRRAIPMRNPFRRMRKLSWQHRSPSCPPP